MLTLGCPTNGTPTLQADCIGPCASDGYLGRLSPDSSLCFCSLPRTAISAVYKDLSSPLVQSLLTCDCGGQWAKMAVFDCLLLLRWRVSSTRSLGHQESNPWLIPKPLLYGYHCGFFDSTPCDGWSMDLFDRLCWHSVTADCERRPGIGFRSLESIFDVSFVLPTWSPVSVLGSDLEPPASRLIYSALSPASPSAVAVGRILFRCRLKLKTVTYI